MVERVFAFPPAELLDWAREHDWPLLPGSAGQGTEGTDWEGGLVLTSPDNGTVYRLSVVVPADYQTIRVAVRPADGATVAEVTLVVDGQPLATLTAAPFEALWQLTVGEHTFEARGTDSEGRSLTSVPVSIRVLPP